MSTELFLLIGFGLLILLFLIYFPRRHVWYDKKHGLKHTITSTGVQTEWDFQSPLIMLKMLGLFVQGEFDTEKRNKYIKQYTRMKESLKKEGYDMSDFPDYEIR